MPARERDRSAPVPGTRGYPEDPARFAVLTESVPFEDLHACLLPLLPPPGAHVADLGAGTGRDAAALAARGYRVVALEPHARFLEHARTRYPSPSIRWVGDRLPELARIADERFDFVLCHGVWQHLDPAERAIAMARVATLLNAGGIFALALRHGPAGAGTHYFPADPDETVALAASTALDPVLRLEDQPSHMPNKRHVTWTRLALRKRATA